MKRLAILLLGGGTAWGQCVMCFRTAAAQNAARAQVLNMGVVLLGLPPFFILAGFLLLAWRRNRAYADDRVECRGLRPGTLPHHRTCGFPHPAVEPSNGPYAVASCHGRMKP